MLILTRKANEQILIGDNIKITLVRVRGNSVRIGIDAPREVRVIRGELELDDRRDPEAVESEFSDREQVFAHPQAKIISGRVKVAERRAAKPPARKRHTMGPTSHRPALVGCLRSRGNDGKPPRAPLSDFLSAT